MPSLELVFEIGVEEIPAGFLAGAFGVLEKRAAAALKEARLQPEDLRTVGAPRRLTLLVQGLPESQSELEEQVVGPPARVAFDDSGKPTRAAVGFAQRNGIDVEALERGEVPGKKGEYLLCTRREPGRPARDVLPELLTTLVADMPWPKSMRWNWREEAFVRPLRWMTCVLGGEALPVSYAGVSAGATSRGHRFLAPHEVEFDGTIEGYLSALRAAFVIVEPMARRDMVAAELARLERETGYAVRLDPELVDEVTHLVEYPVGICGSFDKSFLEVPEQVIVSAMRSHQRYFAMEDSDGALVSRFVTIAGTITKSTDVVRAGNERVLAARLADAQFFFREDRKRTLEEWAGSLADIVFQKKLGTIGAKVERIRAAAAELSAELGVDSELVDRAAVLCKADLATHMVGEFPDLQGTMGGHYARIGGEPDEVARAIEEHYWPVGAHGELPGSDVGAIVGLSDRLDTIVGCFAASLAPTGSADPYGLRRAALAVLRVLADRGWTLDLGVLVDRAASKLEGTVEVTSEIRGDVLEFLRVRLRGLLSDGLQLPPDCVEAALAVGFSDPRDARQRAEAVAALRGRADFEPLAVAFKRVANILKGTGIAAAPDPQVFVDDDESALWSAFCDIQGRVDDRLKERDYGGALQVLAELRTPVDRFFDSVLVMDKDEKVRNNRLAMLGQINYTFTRIADFRQLAV